MRRIRRLSASAAVSRMSTAVALSVAFHVFLIYGFSLPADPRPAARIAMIHAQLNAAPAFASPPRARRHELEPEPESARSEPAPATEPLALAPAAESATAPVAASVVNDTQSALASGDSIASLNIPDPVQYAAKDLDIYPQVLQPIRPLYPQAAREAQVAGFVTLMVSIDEAGRVVGTSVTDAAPDGVFEQFAQQALVNAAFYPAQKEGRTVRSRILIKVEFDPALADAAQ